MNRSDAAVYLDVTPAYITYLVKKGVIKRNENGEYDEDHIRVNYIRSLRKGQGGAASIPSAEERGEDGQQEAMTDSNLKTLLLSKQLEKEVEQTRKLRRENDEAEGLIIPADEHTAVITAIVKAIKPHLEAIPAKIVRTCPDVPAHLRDTVERQVVRAVNAGVEAAAAVLGPVEGESHE